MEVRRGVPSEGEGKVGLRKNTRRTLQTPLLERSPTFEGITDDTDPKTRECDRVLTRTRQTTSKIDFQRMNERTVWTEGGLDTGSIRSRLRKRNFKGQKRI